MSATTKRCLMLLEKCKNMKQLKQSHAQVITCGLAINSFALSRLLAFCSDPQHGSSCYGLKIFEQIENPTICICNTMIKAILLSGEVIGTIQVYTNMMRIGMNPDNYTLPYVLKACGVMESCHLGESIHGQSLKLGFLSDIFVGNSLISMYSAFHNMVGARYLFDEIHYHNVMSWTILIHGYSRTGDVESARLVFDEMPVRKDRGIWGCMISGYVQNNCFKEGLQMFRLMQLNFIDPDEAVLVSVLCACAHLGSLEIGIWVHRYMCISRLPMSPQLGTALIDMYAKCGYLDLAEKVFEEITHRDTICWNAMLSGLAMHGDGERALKFFSVMKKSQVRPDDITFIAIFTACSYSGMAYEALSVLNSMCNVYNIEPKIEHYGCIIDFLGRAGLFEEAKTIIQTMPNSRNSSEKAINWRSLLSACSSHGEIQMAEVVAERLFELERHSGAYVMLSNTYSALGKHDSAKRMRKMMKSRRIEKTPGCSSVEIDGVVSEFVAGEKRHLQMKEIHGCLEIMNKQLDFLGCNLSSYQIDVT